MFHYQKPLFLYGLGIWAAATVALRWHGQYLLRPNHPLAMVVLFVISFPLMAGIVTTFVQPFSPTARRLGIWGYLHRSSDLAARSVFQRFLSGGVP